MSVTSMKKDSPGLTSAGITTVHQSDSCVAAAAANDEIKKTKTEKNENFMIFLRLDCETVLREIVTNSADGMSDGGEDFGGGGDVGAEFGVGVVAHRASAGVGGGDGAEFGSRKTAAVNRVRYGVSAG